MTKKKILHQNNFKYANKHIFNTEHLVFYLFILLCTYFIRTDTIQNSIL